MPSFEFEGRFTTYVPEMADPYAAAYLLLHPNQKDAFVDEDGFAVVLTNWPAVREFFSRTFPDGKPLVDGGVALEPFGYVALGRAEWAAFQADPDLQDRFREYESAADVIYALEQIALARIDQLRRDLKQ